MGTRLLPIYNGNPGQWLNSHHSPHRERTSLCHHALAPRLLILADFLRQDHPKTQICLMDFDEFLQPAICAVTGKPGAGKSYFSTRLIIEEIKRENRNIITNIPINKSALRAHCGKDFYLYELQTFTDNRFFFTQRGDYSYELEQGSEETIDFSKYLKEDDGGCLYIIDEAHLYFNSRNWKFMSQATLSFFTFIRHCGDTLIYLTQKFSDVDSQLRGKTQSFNLLRNLSKERLGWFKRGSGFRVYQYLREKDIENYDNAVQDFTYPFDKRIGACYQTSLFNKKRDEHYKIKGITLKQVGVAVVLVLGGVIYWVASGGWLDAVDSLVPQIGDAASLIEVNSTEVARSANQVADPFFKEVPALQEYEIPQSVFSGMGTRFQKVTQEEAKQFDSLIFGERRLCKLSFFVESKSQERGYEFSFDGLWNKFAKINNISGSFTSFGGTLSTDIFTAFLTYARNNSDGSTLKEVTIILKESIPCTLSQGYEIPLARTIGTQGVLQTNYEYRKVGFDLEMVAEVIDDRELLSIKVQNTQVLDTTAQVPVMLSFNSENVYEVEKGQTYEIALFDSKIQEKSKKLLGNKTLSRNVVNRVFLSYGQ